VLQSRCDVFISLKVFLDVTYEYVVEQQPIGKELFYQFCEKDASLNNCIHFLDAVVSDCVELIIFSIDCVHLCFTSVSVGIGDEFGRGSVRDLV